MGIPGKIKNLAGVSLERLPEVDDSALPAMLKRVLDRVDRSGTSISGYNGAGGLSGDVNPDKSEPLL
jgi:FXSXX-COOH protein